MNLGRTMITMSFWGWRVFAKMLHDLGTYLPNHGGQHFVPMNLF